MEREFGKVSRELTQTLSIREKKQGGIYFTPRGIIEQIFERVPLNEVNTILEPSCGSMEFIRYLEKCVEGKRITAIEKNEKIYEKISRENFVKNRVTVILSDFLDLDVPIFGKFDLIIGNPPYYVMKQNSIPDRWASLIEGRPNVFALFILRAIEMLSPGGTLAFVLPTAFLNSGYYESVRRMIVGKMTVVDIIDNRDTGNFMGTGQATCSLIVKNSSGDNSRWVFESGNIMVFSGGAPELKRLSHGGTSLHELGCAVYIGKVLWNTIKDMLTDDQRETLLIYSTDISSENKIVTKSYTNSQKKNYICRRGITRQLIVVNRGYGRGTYKFRWALVDGNRAFLVENHLICIENDDQSIYSRILASFADPRTEQFIKIYFGNGAISATELEHILPIY